MLNGMFKKTNYVTLASDLLKRKGNVETDKDEDANVVIEEEQEVKPTVPEGMFVKCKTCKAVVYTKDLEENLFVCPKCGYYHRVNAWDRIAMVIDEDTFEEWDPEMDSDDPLSYPDYLEKIESLRAELNINEAVITGKGKINGEETVIAVMDSRFMMASMGKVVGEKITRAIEGATKLGLPIIIFTCSGGARMQEGMISLMQMAKTSAALKRHAQAKLPYFTVITDPTTGGVTASFATLGDVILAEPEALIGFAGQRVIEQTIRQKLPKGFQRAEFSLQHGQIDAIVERKDLKKTLGHLIIMHRPYSKTEMEGEA